MTENLSAIEWIETTHGWDAVLSPTAKGSIRPSGREVPRVNFSITGSAVPNGLYGGAVSVEAAKAVIEHWLHMEG